MLSNLSCNRFPVDTSPQAWGDLRVSNDAMDDPDKIRERAKKDGYIFVKGLIDRETVIRAREEILLKYAIAGEIDTSGKDVMDGVLRSESYVKEVNLEALVSSLRSGYRYESVINNDRLLDLYCDIFNEPAVSFDYRWPRMMRVGEGCGIHADIPYVGRGSKDVWTSWLPLGDIPLNNGPLIILEGSHRNPSLSDYFEKDAAKERLGWLERNPVELQRKIGGRWLSTNFEMGDALCFCGYLVHGALDNNSSEGKCRLSSDTRYQPKSHAKDSRWFGEVSNPYGGDYEQNKRVFYPGLVKGDGTNSDLKEEWKSIGPDGKLIVS